MAEKGKNQGQTGIATLEPPETHQTQATTGSPQAGGGSTAGSQGAGAQSSGASTGTSSTSGSPGSSSHSGGSMSGSSSQTGSSASGTQSGASSTGSQAGGSSMTGGQTGGSSMSGTGGYGTGSLLYRGGSPYRSMARRGLTSPTSLFGNPFGMMRSLVDDMDRFFDDFLGIGSGSSQYRQPSLSSGRQDLTGGTGGGSSLWYPQIEVSEREGNLVVCADLPGMKKEDVHLEIHDDYLVLEGERRYEQERNEGGFYRSERNYGHFYRTIPLPEGVNPEQAQANFKDGVLEVKIPVPQRDQQQQRGRRIEIR